METARAALLAADADSPAPHTLVIRSPIRGRVLRVLHESEGVVGAGSPLVEIGDTNTLEAVIDVLSEDAVRVRPGAPVFFEHWGGEGPLRGMVRLIEPSAFTKVSALGVEEQLVNVIAGFADRPDQLGDSFRLDARIVTWRGEALKVPATALYREHEAWSVFVVEHGRGRRRPVTVGHQSTTEAEIVAGIRPGEQVVTHPSDQVRDGVRVSIP